MLKNYLTIALRNLRRHKGYAFINIAGLAVGIACVMLLLLFVQHELTYDRFHEKADRIYRVIADKHFGDRDLRGPSTSGPLAAALVESFPEVEQAVRISFNRSATVTYEAQPFELDGLLYTDSAFFDVFSFSLLAGDPQHALSRPRTVILTESAATRLFGDKNPIGEVIFSKLLGEEAPFEVTGVMADVPTTSHLPFEMIVSFESIFSTRRATGWSAFSYATYVLLREGHALEDLVAKLPAFANEKLGKERVQNLQFHYELQPLLNIHLGPDRAPDKGDIRYVYLFSAIALMILLIAGANYMILATARSVSRMREVGLRKVMGAHRGQLARQFLGESLFFGLLCIPPALLLVYLALPTFNTLFGKAITLDPGHNALFLLGLFGVVLFVGLVAGSYPALFLSAFRPADVLRSRLRAGRLGIRFRRVMIVFQFTISIALIVGTVVIQRQLHFFQHKNLGFDKEHVVVLDLYDPAIRPHGSTLKKMLLQSPHVIAATLSDGVPGGGFGFGSTVPAEDMPEDKSPMMQIVSIDTDYLKTLGIPLVEGRGFSEALVSDLAEGVLLNEAAVRKLGWQNSTDKRVRFRRALRPVLGVVRDFHFRSLHDEIGPVMMRVDSIRFIRLSVRLRADHIEEGLAVLETQWTNLAPTLPFSYRFLDDDIDFMYRKDRRFGQIIASFGGLAIFIACLGLFGLAAFIAEQRTKEIGIRKVMGATVGSIVLLLSKDFAKLMLAAFVLATPLAYFVMNRWLEDFAYRIELSWVIFLMAGLIALVIACLAVSYQSIKAALTDPAESIRYE